MQISIVLEKGETIEEADEALVKAITSKYDRSKMPHPDPAVDEVAFLFNQEYSKMIVEMMKEIIHELNLI